jgi:alpha-1,3-rhamnosyl/mannosyltransferase
VLFRSRQLVGLGQLAVRGELPFRVSAFGAPGFAAAHPEVVSPICLADGPRWIRNRPARVAAEHTWLAARTRRAALVHHGGGTMPAIGARPAVLTVHDLQFLTYPNYVHPAKLAYLRRAVRASVRRATVVVVPSEYVAASVIDAYGTDPAKVVVVPHGIDLTRPAPDAIRAVRARYGLADESYLVFPGITHPHKGHRFLLDVLAARPDGPRLVLLGGRGAADAELSAAIAAAGLGNRIFRPGRVQPDERDALVAGAEALVFPSEYEGFGAPVVEAMALGTPVICSDRTALPGVVGDAALVTPLVGDAWVAALDALPERRDALVAAGYARAARFSERHSAEALVAAYRLALR